MRSIMDGDLYYGRISSLLCRMFRTMRGYYQSVEDTISAVEEYYQFFGGHREECGEIPSEL